MNHNLETIGRLLKQTRVGNVEWCTWTTKCVDVDNGSRQIHSFFPFQYAQNIVLPFMESSQLMSKITRPKAKTPVTKQDAIDHLRHTGKGKVADLVDKWRNTEGKNHGWDAWFRSEYRHFAQELWPDLPD